MTERDDEMDRLYDMFSHGEIPRPLKILLVIVSIFFGPILALIDKIDEKSS